jgi:tetratricopeptide (TPR) repeat protein
VSGQRNGALFIKREKHMRTLAVLVTALVMTIPASAQMIVLGTGLSRSCYESALYGTSVSKTDIENCSKALTEMTLNREKRLATYVNRGILLMRDGQYDRALTDFDVAIKMDDTLGATHLNRGAALIYKTEYDAALDALNRAIELETKDLHAAYYNRALAYERKGDLTAAYYDLKKSLDLKPDFTPAAEQIDRYIVKEAS